MYDAIVIGGGVVGAALAYQLVCGGARTLLLDRADAGRATDAGAGTRPPRCMTWLWLRTTTTRGWWPSSKASRPATPASRSAAS